MTRLILILGDQLSHNNPCLSTYNNETDKILMCEVWDETTYVKHHKKKIAFLFSAMRHFAQELQDKHYNVIYQKLDNNKNSSFTSAVESVVNKDQIAEIIVGAPGEYRVLKMIKSWQKKFSIKVTILPDNKFLSTAKEFSKWAEGKKQLRMEFFYREMRKKYNILMNGSNPEGGKWNYDSENRSSADPKLKIPKPYSAKIDDITEEVINLVNNNFKDHFGDIEPFYLQ